MYEICNAVIDSVELMIEDHGMLTLSLMVDYSGSGQGLPGVRLCSPKGKWSEKGNYGSWYLKTLMETLEVTKLSALKGKAVRVKRDPGWGGLIRGVGHIIKNNWFIPEEDWKKEEAQEC